LSVDLLGELISLGNELAVGSCNSFLVVVDLSSLLLELI